MIEPTEAKESLDAFAGAVEEVLARPNGTPRSLSKPPIQPTPVRRLDEVKATRKPIVRQPLSAP